MSLKDKVFIDEIFKYVSTNDIVEHHKRQCVQITESEPKYVLDFLFQYHCLEDNAESDEQLLFEMKKNYLLNNWQYTNKLLGLLNSLVSDEYDFVMTNIDNEPRTRSLHRVTPQCQDEFLNDIPF
tara:strand:+ start:1633 stop:2007 length:375 start_codon:yes stop_codon:yes gene_type:complete